MQSFVIASKKKEAKEEYVKKICADYRIDRFDIYIVEQEKGTIGIEEVRNLQKKLFLKPLKSPTKAVVVKNAENLTITAQNALLKSLEEPPENTIIILTVSNKDLLLPTILSRCKIIELKGESPNLQSHERSTFNVQLSTLLKSEVGERLKLAQDTGKTKEEALIWLESIILAIRNELIKQPSRSQYLDLLKSLQKTHTILQTTNANPRFALETLFLNL